jgi:hypothetical protein
VGWRCLTCSTHSADGRPAPLISYGDSLCRRCGEAQMPDLVTSLEVPGPYAELPLLSLGVRPDEVLLVRLGLEERFVWLDLLDQRLPASWADRRAHVAAVGGDGDDS